MRILYIASVRIPNEKASGLAIMRQCEAFSHEGHHVTLLVPHRENSIKEDSFMYYGMKASFLIVTMKSIDFYERMGKIGFYIARLSQMLSSCLFFLRHRKDFDVVYSRDPWMLWLPLFFRASVKFVCEVHKTYPSRYVRSVVNRTDVVVCISQGLKTYFQECTGRTDMVVEPSGVNLDQFKTAALDGSYRMKFYIPNSKKVIAYIGKYTTMGETKGVDDLIRAFGKLRVTFPSIHLFLVGIDGKEEVACRQLCARSGIEDSDVTLVPLVQRDFKEYVLISDIVVMNYPNTEHFRHYMSPTKLFAYMGSGKLVVASDLPSIREIADESMVVFTEPGTVDSLVSALTRAVTMTDEEREKITATALVRVGQFDWNERARRIMTLL